MSIEKHMEVQEFVEEAGLPNADEVLAHLGFRVQSGKGWLQMSAVLNHQKKF
ncbi:MAG: hypothetical protein WAV32_01710 [Halobacteriota archaeon]